MIWFWRILTLFWKMIIQYWKQTVNNHPLNRHEATRLTIRWGLRRNAVFEIIEFTAISARSSFPFWMKLLYHNHCVGTIYLGVMGMWETHFIFFIFLIFLNFLFFIFLDLWDFLGILLWTPYLRLSRSSEWLMIGLPKIQESKLESALVLKRNKVLGPISTWFRFF